MPVHHSKLPDFDSLPAVQGMPQGCAWGIHDADGKRDQCGTLNLLTPDVVSEAHKEIQKGESVALNWRMDNVQKPGFGRKPLEHRIFDLAPFKAHDDEIHINTQAGSQWDGFKHWGHQKTGKYYNNLAHEDVIESKDNGIHHWTERGGIVARGILIDYVAYAERKGIKYDAWTRHEIKLSEIKDIIKEENLQPRPGDIFIVRSGFVKRYEEATDEQRVDGIQKNHNYVGIQGSEEMIKWLWNNHFAAIAGDTIAMEAWPPQAPWCVHDFSLALWGEPIGELWNLEKLATKCEQEKKWSFFFTSAPLNVHGGIASPPNALAIF